MRYIGGKSILLDNIYSEILNAGDVSTVMDIFSGSGVVGNYLKTKGLNVYSNDFLYFSYVLAAEYVKNTRIVVCFVLTNSVC